MSTVVTPIGRRGRRPTSSQLIGITKHGSYVSIPIAAIQQCLPRVKCGKGATTNVRVATSLVSVDGKPSAIRFSFSTASGNRMWKTGRASVRLYFSSVGMFNSLNMETEKLRKQFVPFEVVTEHQNTYLQVSWDVISSLEVRGRCKVGGSR